MIVIARHIHFKCALKSLYGSTIVVGIAKCAQDAQKKSEKVLKLESFELVSNKDGGEREREREREEVSFLANPPVNEST